MIKLKVGIDIDIEAQHYPLDMIRQLLEETIDELDTIQKLANEKIEQVNYPIEFDKLQNRDDKGYLMIAINKVGS